MSLRWSTLLLVTLLPLTAPAGARADTYVDSFEGGVNAGGWTYFAPSQTIETDGGNPGAYLHAWELDTIAPQPRTQGGSIFTGDYRAAGVTAIGVDLRTFAVDFSAEGRPLTLMLYSDNGTPGDPDDDWAAYTMGPNIPLPDQGWIEYDFAVPSDEASLPAGWATIALGPDSPVDMDWNAVITDVAQAGFFYGDPTMFFIFQMWNVGLDNARITTEGPVPVEAGSWGGLKARFQ